MAHYSKPGEPKISLPDLPQEDVLILPSEVRDGIGLYDDSSVTFAKELQSAGLNTAYLYDPDSRQWITELGFSGDTLSIVLGIVSAASWQVIYDVLLRRKKSPVHAKIFRYRGEDHDPKWEYFEFEGKARDVAELIRSLGESQGNEK